MLAPGLGQAQPAAVWAMVDYPGALRYGPPTSDPLATYPSISCDEHRGTLDFSLWVPRAGRRGDGPWPSPFVIRSGATSATFHGQAAYSDPEDAIEALARAPMAAPVIQAFLHTGQVDFSAGGVTTHAAPVPSALLDAMIAACRTHGT